MFSRFLQDNHVCVCVCVCVRACVRACVRVLCVSFLLAVSLKTTCIHPFIPFTHIQISLHNIGISGSFTEKGLSAWAK